jgi:quercetin dioxygenase-like cupin family protein
VTKLLALASLALALALALGVAACGGAPKPAAPSPMPDPLGSNVEQPPGPASNEPPPDAADRKHAFVKLPTELSWTGNSASVGENLRFQKIQNGAAFDVTDGPVVVVQGKVTTSANQEIAYWSQKPHRIQCAKGTDCILFVHANAPAEAKELLAKDIQWAPLDPSRPDPLVSPLWGDGTKTANGFLMKMKAGGAPFWHIHRRDYHGVVLAGNVVSYESGTQPREMPPGSYWWQPNGNKHTTDCKGPSDCVIYLDFTGAFDVKPVP